MPLFCKKEDRLRIVKQENFALERALQETVEQNLEEIFSCRFIASEFYTGDIHAGRIDTLALSEDNNPVIIEYKKVESSSLINQALFYLSWLKDHKGDFQVAVDRALGGGTEVDWSGVRVICIAPGYKKYDLHAYRMIEAPIELWKYKNYENGMFSLDEILNTKQTKKEHQLEEVHKDYRSIVYSQDKLMSVIESDTLIESLNEVREHILSFSETIDETPKKMYTAYRSSKNFACIECRRRKVMIFLKLTREQVAEYGHLGRDVSLIGHYGTGNFEFELSSVDDIENAKMLTRIAFDNIG